jgi:amino acid adenylation domain-containing protein
MPSRPSPEEFEPEEFEMDTRPTHAPDETLAGFLLAAARSTPDSAAVVEFGGRTTTYRELARQAESYARELARLGIDIGERVILESDTSAPAIAMLIACASMGLTFVPVSSETPDARLEMIIEATGPALHLQAGDRAVDAPALARFGPDGLDVVRAPRRRVLHRRELVGTDIAYIIFTSGSTGRPKGVVMSHRAVVAFYRGMLHYDIVGTTDRVASTSPLQFDFSLLDIGLALGSGAAVVPVPRTMLRWPSRFLRVLRETRATQVNGVPSIWRQVLRYAPDELAALEDLRGILFCGEEFPLHELRRLRSLLPEARLVNCYGATESMACSFTDVPDPVPDRLSIGRAHPGAEMIILDNAGRPVPDPGVVGEIHLRSPALFTGYWDDPAATRAALVPDPLQPRTGQVVFRTGDLAYRDERDELHFCGRADAQVQIRGNRVELAEVERALLSCPGVTAGAALLLRPSEPDAELAAFVVVTPEFDEARLGAHCASALPAYMVPGRVCVTDELPLTVNGKVDRGALAARAA